MYATPRLLKLLMFYLWARQTVVPFGISILSVRKNSARVNSLKRVAQKVLAVIAKYKDKQLHVIFDFGGQRLSLLMVFTKSGPPHTVAHTVEKICPVWGDGCKLFVMLYRCLDFCHFDC